MMPMCRFYADDTNMRIKAKNRLIYEDLTYKINGILYTVQNELRRFRNEKEYGDRIEYYLRQSGLNFEREKILPPSFEGEQSGRNRIDFLIENKVILEIKTKRFLTREDYYQTKRYLEALGKKLAILVNFRQKYLKPKRILNPKVTE
jgi:GxxExxY protein